MTYLREQRNLEKLNSSLTYYEHKGLELATKLFRSAKKAYQEGEIEYIEYIGTIEQAIEIRKNHIDKLIQYNRISNRINYLTGKYN